MIYLILFKRLITISFVIAFHKNLKCNQYFRESKRRFKIFLKKILYYITMPILGFLTKILNLNLI